VRLHPEPFLDPHPVRPEARVAFGPGGNLFRVEGKKRRLDPACRRVERRRRHRYPPEAVEVRRVGLVRRFLEGGVDVEPLEKALGLLEEGEAVEEGVARS
jgi:hypothetical protein